MAIEKVINITTNAKQSIDTINKLYSKLQETDKTQEALNEDAKEMGEAYKDSSKESIQAIDKQSKAMKGLQSVSGGVKKGFQAVGTVFKGLGIGLLVALVAKLTQVLSENQKVVDFVSTVSTAFSIVINDLINKFTDIFAKISEATGGFDALGKVVGGVVKIAFNQLKLTVLGLQAGFTALKLAYEKVFGDDKGVLKAQKDLDEIGNKIKETIKDTGEQGKTIAKNIGEAVGEVVDGVSILVKDGAKAISEIDAKGAFAQAEAITRNKKNFELLALQQERLVQQYENEAELQRQIRDDVSKSIDERLKANSELGKILDKQAEAEKKTIQSRIASLQNEQNLLGFTQERYNEIYQLQTDLLAVTSKITGQKSEQLSNEKAIVQEQKDLAQSQIDTQNELAIAQKEFDAEQEKTELAKLEKLKEKIALEQEIALAEIERKRELYALDTQNRVDAENEYLLKKDELDKALIENTKAKSAEEIRIEEEKTAKEKELAEAVKNAKVDIAGQTLQLIGELSKEGSKVGKAVAVAQATISGIEGVQNAFTTANKSPTTAVFPAYPYIQAGLAGAFSALQIKKILSTDPSKGGGSSSVGGSGGGSAPSAPSFNLVQGTGSNQIAESLTTERRPIQAYVVASNVTSAQELDRNSVSEATV
jgi:hypothetical protein